MSILYKICQFIPNCKTISLCRIINTVYEGKNMDTLQNIFDGILKSRYPGIFPLSEETIIFVSWEMVNCLFLCLALSKNRSQILKKGT